jgi:hypothetical protein
VALTDRGCASACGSFTSTVKDLGLGTLVGTRASGAVSGPGVGLACSASGRRMAVKVVHEQSARDPQFRIRLRQEAVAGQRHRTLPCRVLTLGPATGEER